MTSSIAHIPHASIPFTQHHNGAIATFDTVDACRNKNFAKFYKSLSGIVNNLCISSGTNLKLNNISGNISVTGSGTATLSAEEFIYGDITIDGNLTSVSTPQDPKSVYEYLEELTCHKLPQWFTFPLLVINKTAGTVAFNYFNNGTTVTDNIDSQDSIFYQVVVNTSEQSYSVVAVN